MTFVCSKKEVEQYTAKGHILSCQLRLKWTGEGHIKSDLFYQICQIGAKGPRNFTSIESDLQQHSKGTTLGSLHSVDIQSEDIVIFLPHIYQDALIFPQASIFTQSWAWSEDSSSDKTCTTFVRFSACYHQGIPSRLQKAVIIVVGFSEQRYTLLEHSYQQLYHME